MPDRHLSVAGAPVKCQFGDRFLAVPRRVCAASPRSRRQGGAPAWTNDLDAGEERRRLVAGEDHPGRVRGRPGLSRSTNRRRFGDMMIDGVSRGAGRGGPLGLSRPSSRGWRQCLLGSRPRRGASGDGQDADWVVIARPPGHGGSGRRCEGVLAEGAQPVVTAAGQLAGHRQRGALPAEPVGDLTVVVVVGAGGAGGAAGGLIQRPAQQRRALAGQPPR